MSDGIHIAADEKINGGPSASFDLSPSTTQLHIIGKAGISPGADEGVVKVNNADDASSFLKQCRKIKLWSGEDKTKMADAK